MIFGSFSQDIFFVILASHFMGCLKLVQGTGIEKRFYHWKSALMTLIQKCVLKQYLPDLINVQFLHEAGLRYSFMIT